MTYGVRVSIIIPAYNAQRYIAGAVASARAQTLRDIEIIVVDDGSRDGTATAALDAAGNDPRVRVICYEMNRGAAHARNVALAVASGIWIAPLDADDAFSADRLARLVPLAEGAGADLLADNILLERPGAAALTAFRHGERFPHRPLSLSRFLALDTPGSEDLPAGFMHPLMRRTFLERHGLNYPEDIHAGEDFHLYVRALLRGARLFCIRDAYYRARVRADSLSRADPQRNSDAFARSIAALRADAEALGQRPISRALGRRADAFASYAEYSRLADALRERRLGEALRRFPLIATQRYTWRRLRDAVARRLVPRRPGALRSLGGS
ncbi:MAG: glycosyltransferase family 2 protein [Candidatus Eremiobacteraeota bacterium]|nr:glycosyltransferase family 2 protein [Candidatus Eremiobacteraeota bacterium]